MLQIHFFIDHIRNLTIFFIIFFDQIRFFSGSGSGSTKRSAVIVLRGHGNMGKTTEAGTGGTGATKWQGFHSLCLLISHRFSSFVDPMLIQLFCASIAYTIISANLCPGKSGKSLQAYRFYILVRCLWPTNSFHPPYSTSMLCTKFVSVSLPCQGMVKTLRGWLMICWLVGICLLQSLANFGISTVSNAPPCQANNSFVASWRV